MTRLAASSRWASTRRWRRPPSATGRPPSVTSSGPRSRNASWLAMRSPPRGLPALARHADYGPVVRPIPSGPREGATAAHDGTGGASLATVLEMQVLTALIVGELAGDLVLRDRDQIVEVERPHAHNPVACT